MTMLDIMILVSGISPMGCSEYLWWGTVEVSGGVQWRSLVGYSEGLCGVQWRSLVGYSGGLCGVQWRSLMGYSEGLWWVQWRPLMGYSDLIVKVDSG